MFIVPIAAPFGDMSGHIIEFITIDDKTTYWSTFTPLVFTTRTGIVSIVVCDLIIRWTLLAAKSTSGCILSFGFCG